MMLESPSAFLIQFFDSGLRGKQQRESWPGRGKRSMELAMALTRPGSDKSPEDSHCNTVHLF